MKTIAKQDVKSGGAKGVAKVAARFTVKRRVVKLAGVNFLVKDPAKMTVSRAGVSPVVNPMDANGHAQLNVPEAAN